MVTLAGVLLFHLALQMLKGPPSLGSFSCPVLVCVEREAIEMAPPPVCNSALSPCLHVCLACFLIIISSLISLQAIFPQSTADLALRLLTNIYAQLPAAEQSRGLASLSRVYMAVARVICDSYSIQTVRSASSLSNSLKFFTSVPNSCFHMGSNCCFSYHPLTPTPGTDPVLLTLFFFNLLPWS